jgi:hypothetical protein
VRSITGAQSQTFRVFNPDPAGQRAMGAVTLRLLIAMLGWMGAALAAGGLILAAVRPDRAARRLWWLAMSPLSYYLTFIAVVGYNYDRFLLPIALVLALFAGLAIDALWKRGRSAQRLATALASVAIAWSIARASLVDVAMVRDSRYDVERGFARTCIRRNDRHLEIEKYLPRLDGFRVAHDPQQVDAAIDGASHVVVNAEFAARFDLATSSTLSMPTSHARTDAIARS